MGVGRRVAGGDRQAGGRRGKFSGDIVLRLFAKRKEDCSDADPVFDDYVHISAQSWNPVQPSFRRLVVVPREEAPCPVHASCLLLLGLHVYQTVYEYCRERAALRNDVATCRMSVYRLWNAPKPIAEMHVDHVEVELASDLTVFEVNPFTEGGSKVKSSCDKFEKALAELSSGSSSSDEEPKEKEQEKPDDDGDKDISRAAIEDAASNDSFPVSWAMGLEPAEAPDHECDIAEMADLCEDEAGVIENGPGGPDEHGSEDTLSLGSSVVEALENMEADPNTMPEAELADLEQDIEARAILETPHGLIRYYDYGPKRYMVAECRRHGKRCRCTKVTTSSVANPAQGRPLGFLLAWLKLAKDHKSHLSHVHLAKPSPQLRREARTELFFLDGAQFFSEQFERPRDMSVMEEEEPEGTP